MYHINKKNLDNLNGTCKPCRKERSAKRYKEKRGHILSVTKLYQKNNKKRVRAKQRVWALKNRDRINKQKRNREKKRRKVDLGWAISKDLSSRLSHILSGRQKCTKTLNILKCSKVKLMGHLESRFNDYMTWKNRGKHGWHVDHIIPQSAFNMENPLEQRVCFWYKNLQPLWAKDNIEKNDKYKEEDKKLLIKQWIFYNI